MPVTGIIPSIRCSILVLHAPKNTAFATGCKCRAVNAVEVRPSVRPSRHCIERRDHASETMDCVANGPFYSHHEHWTDIFQASLQQGRNLEWSVSFDHFNLSQILGPLVCILELTRILATHIWYTNYGFVIWFHENSFKLYGSFVFISGNMEKKQTCSENSK